MTHPANTPASGGDERPLAEQAKHHGRDWAVWWQGSTTGPSGERGDHIMELRQNGVQYARELAYIGADHHDQAGVLVAEHNEQMRRLREVIARQAAAKGSLQKEVARLSAALAAPTPQADGGVVPAKNPKSAIPPEGSEERAFWLEAAEQHGFEETSGGEEIPEYDPPAYFATQDEVLKLLSAARQQGWEDALAAAPPLNTGSAVGGGEEPLTSTEAVALWEAEQKLSPAPAEAGEDLAGLSARAPMGPYCVSYDEIGEGPDRQPVAFLMAPSDIYLLTDENYGFRGEETSAVLEYLAALDAAYRSGRLTPASRPAEQGEPVAWAETQAARDVLTERRRQVEAEGWTPEHDDAHSRCELATAAACYALAPSPVGIEREWVYPDRPKNWPWHRSWWKPSFYRRNLVKAGALILAEIERWDRMEGATVPQQKLALATTPDLGAQEEPVAWAYESSWLVGQPWTLKTSVSKPAESEWVRNIRPLFAHPAPAASRPAVGRAEPTPAAIEAMAEHLLEEDHGPDWTWPTHRDDDGYRGGGYVTIAPPDVQSHLRDKARRVLIRAAQIASDPRDDTRAGGDQAQEGGR